MSVVAAGWFRAPWTFTLLLAAVVAAALAWWAWPSNSSVEHERAVLAQLAAVADAVRADPATAAEQVPGDVAVAYRPVGLGQDELVGHLYRRTGQGCAVVTVSLGRDWLTSADPEAVRVTGPELLTRCPTW